MRSAVSKSQASEHFADFPTVLVLWPIDHAQVLVRGDRGIRLQLPYRPLTGDSAAIFRRSSKAVVEVSPSLTRTWSSTSRNSAYVSRGQGVELGQGPTEVPTDDEDRAPAEPLPQYAGALRAESVGGLCDRFLQHVRRLGEALLCHQCVGLLDCSLDRVTRGLSS
jgi:hypothetical protein